MSPESRAFVQRRRRQIRYWPYAVVIFVIILVAFYGWLGVAAPTYVNPALLAQQTQTQKLGLNQLLIQAELGDLAIIACGLLLLLVLALTSLSLWNESQLIRILDQQEKDAAPEKTGEASDKPDDETEPAAATETASDDAETTNDNASAETSAPAPAPEAASPEPPRD